ncbi:lipoate--protein ligase [Maribellus maritimus]|uniref:lipoate--protein ligase n=1 Tax=Maribellus maritimus TaxID=2870838 RepID=UPI001EEAC066|nr:lipoate--protein ligase [Maribellus maritimus]MCG6190635.1 lipoate--protein ligase [Maribellus maritimus]
MLCIHLKNTDPFFCLAAEEYLLKKFSEDVFMLWQSKDTVVVGKHQNALAEINYPFVRENNITVARRISGGGTVFHDAGNVNFAFIKNVNSPAEINFKMFTAPVVNALEKLDLNASTSGRNDLLLEGLKISGNAEHVFKNRVLHHGTLLYSSDLENLGQAIKVIPGKYESKAVQSNRSPVANIASFLKKEMAIEDFIQFLLNVQLENKEARFYEPGEKDVQNIQQLAGEKFKTWEWNFGYSPKYFFQNKINIDGREVKVNLRTVKGIINEIKVDGNYFSEKINRQLTEKLLGKRHFFEDIQQALIEVSDKVPDKLVYVFFV